MNADVILIIASLPLDAVVERPAGLGAAAVYSRFSDHDAAAAHTEAAVGKPVEPCQDGGAGAFRRASFGLADSSISLLPGLG